MSFLNDGYDYDANGNVAAISDGRTGNSGDRSMTYDALDRLTQAVAPGLFGTATYSYDVLDNLTRTKVTGGNQVRDHYYCYDATWRLTTLRTGSCTGTTAMSLGYDVQGNLANRNGVAYTFDQGNRLRQVAGQENQYLYDGLGRRVASNRLINGSDVRRSIYGLDGKLLFVQDQGEAKRKEYIYLDGSLLAERSLPNTGAATPVSLRYQHTDALGSPVAVSDESQVVVERTAYEPYGWAANRGARNGPGFTGHQEDAATGLVYMQQRYYDASLGVFLSVDPVSVDTTTAWNLCRYCYAANNPYKFKDPDGRFINFVVGFAIGAGIDATMQVIGSMRDGQSFGDAVSNINVGDVVSAGTVSAIIPGLGNVAKAGYQGVKVAVPAAKAIAKVAAKSANTANRAAKNSAAVARNLDKIEGAVADVGKAAVTAVAHQILKAEAQSVVPEVTVSDVQDAVKPPPQDDRLK